MTGSDSPVNNDSSTSSRSLTSTSPSTTTWSPGSTRAATSDALSPRDGSTAERRAVSTCRAYAASHARLARGAHRRLAIYVVLVGALIVSGRHVTAKELALLVPNLMLLFKDL